jgi:hypothetical protein
MFIIIFIFYEYNNMTFINYITHHGRVFPTGIRGQCVEFARRWLISHDILFENVEHAIDIWNIPSVIRLSDQQVLPFLSIPNDGRLPTIGSLLIYRQNNELPHGHVAVVISVDSAKRLIYIDERNWREHPKIIPILENGRLDDPTIIGWKVVM